MSTVAPQVTPATHMLLRSWPRHASPQDSTCSTLSAHSSMDSLQLFPELPGGLEAFPASRHAPPLLPLPPYDFRSATGMVCARPCSMQHASVVGRCAVLAVIAALQVLLVSRTPRVWSAACFCFRGIYIGHQWGDADCLVMHTACFHCTASVLQECHAQTHCTCPDCPLHVPCSPATIRWTAARARRTR